MAIGGPVNEDGWLLVKGGEAGVCMGLLLCKKLWQQLRGKIGLLELGEMRKEGSGEDCLGEAR
ncbi:unnamed protein product [Dovyalis caffra]|uniref:Uncharacterized protein n=1 Tax=Dovyalis caffra TaxID=77055 RepID=A0AAV1SKR5_9ROSI|nr:unnamed protein product [Dovyalis caffra]